MLPPLCLREKKRIQYLATYNKIKKKKTESKLTFKANDTYFNLMQDY